MFKLIRYVTFVLLILPACVSAQQGANYHFKYGKVSPDEFKTTVTGPDSAAAAIKIFDVGEGHFEVNTKGDYLAYVFERHFRYKIVNKTGYSLADMEIQLYAPSMSSQEKLDFVRGATYNLVNQKIETSKMMEDAKFSTRLNKDYVVKKFTLPNVKEGSIIEFTYKTTSDFIFSLNTWYFQDRYPCKYSSFTLHLPEYYHYKTSTGGYLLINRPPASERKENFNFHSTSTEKSGSVEMNIVTTQYYAENIPAIKDENYITTIKDYVSKIGFELTLADIPGIIHRDYSSSWPQLVTKMMSLDGFGGYLKRNNYSKELLKTIIGEEKDPEVKLNLIYEYVKGQLKWNGDYDNFAVASTQKEVLAKKTGNSAEINLILYTLLKDAGIECYPVLISTRDNGAHPGYPLIAKFNNVIVQAHLGEKDMLLDAIDKNNMNGLISYENLNHQGLIVNPSSNEAKWIPVEYGIVSKSTALYNLELKEDNTFTGTMVNISDRYNGLQKRTALQQAGDEQANAKRYNSGKPGLEISNYKITNKDQREMPFTESMDVVIRDNVDEAGNLLYFTPLLYNRIRENPFLLEERKFPVDFGYTREENCKVVLTFPAAFHLEKLPASEQINLPDGEGSFSIIYVVEGNTIAIKSNISILKPVFEAEDYETLKELYKNVVRKQAEQIVFKKTGK